MKCSTTPEDNHDHPSIIGDIFQEHAFEVSQSLSTKCWLIQVPQFPEWVWKGQISVVNVGKDLNDQAKTTSKSSDKATKSSHKIYKYM